MIVLHLTDSGCCQHQLRHLNYTGHEARVMADILANLHHNNGYYFYVCDHGHTHRVMFTVPTEEAPNNEA